MKWKTNLLSSSLPLEIEVARLLAKKEFAVSFDYPYKRHDNGEEKEFSFDVHAQAWYPFNEKNDLKIDIDFLMECKYRHPSVSWVFVEDLNVTDLETFSSKGVIKFIDEFTDLHTDFKHSEIPDLKICLKGIEIGTQSGEVHEKGILHGSRQLIYAMPQLIHRHVDASLYESPEECKPYLLCPILVTTADLRIFKKDFSIESVNRAESLDDFSFSVPYLSYYSELDPGFFTHCKNTFKGIPNVHQQAKYKSLVDFRKYQYGEDSIPEKFYSQPELLVSDLTDGYGGDIFREILICNFSHLPNLLTEIQDQITKMGSSLEKIVPKNRVFTFKRSDETH